MEPRVEKESVRFARIAEAQGYPSYACGYARSTMGYVINNDFGDAPFGGMPRPDLMVTSTSMCDCWLKGFEAMSRRLNVLLFVLDRPERTVYGAITLMPEDYEVDYYRSQLEDCIAFMHQVTGHKYDPDRLNECLDWSYRLNELSQEVLELRKSVPAPWVLPMSLPVRGLTSSNRAPKRPATSLRSFAMRSRKG